MIFLSTRHICDACGAPATIEADCGVFLCANPCASNSVTAGLPAVNVTTAAESLLPENAAAVVTLNSVSDGVLKGSLPLGESEPAVTLACAPSDSKSRQRDRQAAAAFMPAPSSADAGAVAATNSELEAAWLLQPRARELRNTKFSNPGIGAS